MRRTLAGWLVIAVVAGLVAIAKATRVFFAKAEGRMDDTLAAMLLVLDVAPPSGPPGAPKRVYPNALEQAMRGMEHEKKIAEHRAWTDHRAMQEGLGRAWVEVLVKVAALPLPRETMVGMFTTEKSMSRRALVEMLDRRERVMRGGRSFLLDGRRILGGVLGWFACLPSRFSSSSAVPEVPRSLDEGDAGSRGDGGLPQPKVSPPSLRRGREFFACGGEHASHSGDVFRRDEALGEAEGLDG